MVRTKIIFIGLALLTLLAGCVSADTADTVEPDDPVLTATSLCVRECVERAETCVEEAVRELEECVDDHSDPDQPPICADCILECHKDFFAALEACHAVASECTEACLKD